jgi:hypothetical protein
MVKMSEEDIKLAAINGGTMILSFSNIENTLKIILLLVSIIYTGYKIYEIYENRKNRK